MVKKTLTLFWNILTMIGLKEDMALLSSILAWRIPKDREAWQAIVYGGCKELEMTEQLSTTLIGQ